MNYDIYQYESAPRFLKAVLDSQKQRNLSLRGFSQRAGIKSPATLSLILRGKRAITSDMGHRLSDALNLQGRRKSYFLSLCRLTTLEGREESVRLQEELLQLRAVASTEPLQMAQYRFLSNWSYVTLYVLVGLSDFTPDTELLARKLGNGITAREVANALDDLMQLGLLVKDGDRYRQGLGSVIKTSEDVASLAIQSFHRQMGALALKALNGPVAEREFTGTTVAVAPEQLPEVKEQIRKFRENLDQFIERGKNRKRVYQLNVQFFPITKH